MSTFGVHFKWKRLSSSEVHPLISFTLSHPWFLAVLKYLNMNGWKDHLTLEESQCRMPHIVGYVENSRLLCLVWRQIQRLEKLSISFLSIPGFDSSDPQFMAIKQVEFCFMGDFSESFCLSDRRDKCCRHQPFFTFFLPWAWSWYLGLRHHSMLMRYEAKTVPQSVDLMLLNSCTNTISRLCLLSHALLVTTAGHLSGWHSHPHEKRPRYTEGKDTKGHKIIQEQKDV